MRAAPIAHARGEEGIGPTCPNSGPCSRAAEGDDQMV